MGQRQNVSALTLDACRHVFAVFQVSDGESDVERHPATLALALGRDGRVAVTRDALARNGSVWVLTEVPSGSSCYKSN